MKNLHFLSIITVIVALVSSSCKKDKTPETQLTDRDGNVYKTVKIGNQVWMAENLRTTKLNDGTPIALVTQNDTWSDETITDPMLCYYDNKSENLDQYGMLYNWYAVKSGKLAPEGWHVATEKDWQDLQDYLITNGYNYDGTTSENKTAKSLASTIGWIVDPVVGNVGNDQASNNKSGFNALPAGARFFNGSFNASASEAFWWLTSETDAYNSAYLFIYTSNTLPGINSMSKRAGLSVRCVKD
jgi:uncharacterized protein (TIGR02145 family)